MSSEDRKAFYESLQATDQFSQANSARLWEEVLLPKYPDSGFFLVRVGDARKAFGCKALAMECYLEAQRVEGVGADPVFDLFLEAFKKLCAQEEEDTMYTWSDHAFAYYWQPIHSIPFPEQAERPDIDFIRSRWKSLFGPDGTICTQSTTVGSTTPGVEMYFRSIAIETNVIENLFQLPRNIAAVAVQRGWRLDDDANGNGHHHAPEPINMFTSSSLDPDEILKILDHARSAIEFLYDFVESKKTLTIEIICDLHKLCMEATKFRTTFSKLPSGSLVNVRTKYLPTGRTRGSTRSNVTINAYTGSIQFCPFEEVDNELASFVETSEEFSRQYGDHPFALAAWIHFAFITLHPFQDGNGRISRFLASLPLIRAGLPPLCIPSGMKNKYIAALDHIRCADDPKRFDPLINVFVQGIVDTLSMVDRTSGFGQTRVSSR
ncbi:hypothetical protein FRC03_003597 [Tulasnella sp. 419]|nr:hypothetical protein FRC03_003597 [Tulasnella sp. 419]